MEAMSGDEGLESERVTSPSNEDQSTVVNSDNAWTVTLQAEPLENRDGNPQVTISFKTKIEVRALQLQGSSEQVEDVTFILSYLDEDSLDFTDYRDSSGEPMVSR